MSLRQGISFVSKQEDSYLLSNEYLQKQFLQSVSTDLKNENIRNELWPFLKERALEDKKRLEHLITAMTDKNERQQKISNTPKNTNV